MEHYMNLAIQLTLQIHGFHIHGFNLLQLKILGGNIRNFSEAKLKFGTH